MGTLENNNQTRKIDHLTIKDGQFLYKNEVFDDEQLAKEYKEDGDNPDNNNLKSEYETNKKDGSHLIAKHLVSEYNVKTIDQREREIFIYNNGAYVAGVNTIRSRIQKILEELATAHVKNDILDRIRDLTITDRKDFNPSSNLINLNNGVFDLEKKELFGHNPEYLFFYKIPVDYKPDTDCPAIKKFLSEILNEKDMPIIQEWLGYALYRRYFIKKAVIFVGEKNTGKTTFLRLSSTFIGPNNVSGVSLQKLSSDKFSAAHLYNKHINIFDDLSFKDINDNGAFKIATGGGYITGEYKFGSQFQFENYAKLTFSCNKIPNIKDTHDEAYFSRWIVIEFKKTVENPDKFLIDKLTQPEELSGLLNFALKGLFRILEKHDFSYEMNPEEIKVQMLRSGSVVANFAYDCLEESTDYWIDKDGMYEKFVDYARSENMPIIPKNDFGRKICEYADYLIDSKSDKKTGWRNARFKESKIS